MIIPLVSCKKYMTSAFTLLLIISLPLLVSAQSEKEDVVYLKDGSILRGEIIEQSAGEAIKLQMVGRNVLVINLDEVEKINKEEPSGTAHYKTSGYFNHTGMDMLPSQDGTTVRFQMVNGYQFQPKFSLGLGIAFVPYNDPLGLIPVFVDGRYKFREANTTPFIFGRIGYSFSILSDEDTPWSIENHRGGLVLNPGMGIEFHTSTGFGWYLTAGLNLDNSRFEQERWDGRIVETTIDYRRVQFGFGLLF